MDQRQALRTAAGGMALIEVAMVFATEFWVAAAVMAVVFGAGAWRLGSPRSGRGVVIGLAFAFLVELVPLPFFPRESLADWVPQVATGVLSLVGLVLAVRLLVTHREQAAV